MIVWDMKTPVAIVLMIIVGLVTFVIGTAVPRNVVLPDIIDINREDMYSAQAVGLRVDLQSLFTEHTNLALTAARSMINAAGDYDSILNVWELNSLSLADELAAIYGSDFRDTFLLLWRTQKGHLMQYTTSLLQSDVAARDKSTSDLQANADTIAQLLAEKNSNVSEEGFTEKFQTHATLLQTVIASHYARDFATEYQKQLETSAFTNELALSLADLISKQFPEKF